MHSKKHTKRNSKIEMIFFLHKEILLKERMGDLKKSNPFTKMHRVVPALRSQRQEIPVAFEATIMYIVWWFERKCP